MKVVSIPIPETLPQALKMADDEFSQEARILLAAKLYELAVNDLGSGLAIPHVGGWDQFLTSHYPHGTSWCEDT